MMHLTREQAEGFYAVHKERPFYNDLVAYMTSGPVIVQVLEGEGAIDRNREIMGATNPADAAEGTIRKDFAASIEENVVHGSDGPDTARQEIGFFFGEWRRRSAARDKAPGATMPWLTAAPGVNLVGQPEAALRHFFDGLGEKPFRARQV